MATQNEVYTKTFQKSIFDNGVSKLSFSVYPDTTMAFGVTGIDVSSFGVIQILDQSIRDGRAVFCSSSMLQDATYINKKGDLIMLQRAPSNEHSYSIEEGFLKFQS